MKLLVTAISVIALIGSSLACGQADSRAAGPAALDRIVPRLPNGISTGEVEKRLGRPRTSFEVESGETVLAYGYWHLVFRSSLFDRIRYYRGGYWPASRPVAPLDRKVRALELGSSRQAVERELGKTASWEILSLGSNERLWYGYGRWKLHFSDRRLSGKSLYK